MSTYSTIGGQPTKGEAFAKLLHHLREAQTQAALLSHLHAAQDTRGDDLRAQGWLGIQELIGRQCIQITELAKRGFQ